MSGGVDSSVAAALLAEQGHEVIGVHMKLHDAPTPAAGSKTCCGFDDAMDARRVADRLNIPFYIMDLRTAFQKSVKDYFSAAWLAGRTPNPCVPCNGVLKFDVLLTRARALGASHLATGHYARISDAGGLVVAADRDKDQTYFLFPVTTDALRHTLFPLGGLTKAEVRAEAERLGLVAAETPESQDICFLPEGDHGSFVTAEHPDAVGAGDIVDESGAVLGRHDGYWRFTVGQRRGLGVAVGEPRYVLRVEPETRRVVIGPGERLAERALVASGFNWFRRPAHDEPVAARIRHRGALHPCRVEGADPVTIRFLAPARAVTPGQAVVLYAGDEVLGGGWIHRAVAPEAPTA